VDGLRSLRPDAVALAGCPEPPRYTNEAMSENLAYYPRHGYTETHRAEEDGFRRAYFHKLLTPH
jgi:hypothetical protein